MLIAGLGRHDLILGRQWLAHFQILPDCHQRRLLWPEDVSLIDSVATKLPTKVPRTLLLRNNSTRNIEPRYQRDADRRDRLMELEDEKKPQRIELQEINR